MSRISIIITLLAVVAASPLIIVYAEYKTGIFSGHISDLKGRFSPDEIQTEVMVEGTGMFDETAEDRDAAHWADGAVSIEIKDGKKYIQLQSDFNSGPLPDGWVTYSEELSYIGTWDKYKISNPVEVAPLKKGKGASFYEIPWDAEPKSVTIICKQFKQYIGSAPIHY